MPILMVMVFLLSSSSGCLGLLQARESMEHLRGEPEIQSETIVLKHQKVFTNPTDWEVYENSTTFYIDETVSELIMWRHTRITGSETVVVLRTLLATFVQNSRLRVETQHGLLTSVSLKTQLLTKYSLMSQGLKLETGT